MTFAEYEAHGWALCAIERGKKAPVYDGWNVSAFPAESIEALDNGAGLLHAKSGTCALDIDHMELARPWLAERGIDIDALMAEPSAVMISSGRPGRAKLVYRLTKPLRTLKPKGSGLELRCASADGKSVQDVLPPTIHPDTKKPYEWKYGDDLIAHWSNLPPIPAQLWKAWNDLLSEPVRAVEGVAVQEKPIEIVRKAFFNHVAAHRVDVTDYDQWLNMGMRLHKQTGGAEQGLMVWNEWSRTDTSKGSDGTLRYKGYLSLKEKWLTFTNDDTGVGMDGMIRELPAEAAEFPEEPVDAPADEDSTAEKMKVAAKQQRQEIQATLEKRLIYVKGTEKYFDTRDHRIIQTEGGIENLFSHMMWKNKGGGRYSPVKALKESSTKKVVQWLGFHPGEGVTFGDDHGDEYANTYRDRLPQPVEPTADEREVIEWLFDRISDPTFREYYLQFLAHVVQRPGVKIKSAPLIWSDIQGNGKTTLVRVIPSLLVGSQYSKEVTCAQLNDGFTGYLLDTWHVNLTEFRAGSKGEREAISKKVESWIADDVVTVRPMHAVAHTIPNRFFVTGSSNAEDAASISNQDRKWAIHEMKAAQFTPSEQEWVYAFLGRAKRASAVLRHYFLNLDISTFKPSAKAPETAAKADMVAANVSSDVELITTMWEQREAPLDREVVITSELMAAVHKRCQMKPSANRIGKILTKPPFNGVAFQFRAGESKYRALALKNQDKWLKAPGRAVMDHVQGNDVDVDDPLLT